MYRSMADIHPSISTSVGHRALMQVNAVRFGLW
jgi:hypothetical protein